jgi:hypothetical protein
VMASPRSFILWEQSPCLIEHYMTRNAMSLTFVARRRRTNSRLRFLRVQSWL